MILEIKVVKQPSLTDPYTVLQFSYGIKNTYFGYTDQDLIALPDMETERTYVIHEAVKFAKKLGADQENLEIKFKEYKPRLD